MPKYKNRAIDHPTSKPIAPSEVSLCEISYHKGRPLSRKLLYFYRRRTADKRGKRYIMRERIITMLYAVASFIDDIAYWVIGKGEDEKERTIHTLWGTHYY